MFVNCQLARRKKGTAQLREVVAEPPRGEGPHRAANIIKNGVCQKNVRKGRFAGPLSSLCERAMSPASGDRCKTQR
jgi:hypothetical protein